MTAPRVYLAGAMPERYDGAFNGPAPWRSRLGRWLKRCGIDTIYPETLEVGYTPESNHGDWRATVDADLAAIKSADVVYAEIRKPDRDGTISEISYASAIGKPVIVADREGDLSEFVFALPGVLHGTIGLAAQRAWRDHLTPIEQPMAKALNHVQGFEGWAYFDVLRYPGDSRSAVLCQWPIGPWRVDFLIGRRLVVECDGVTYHSDRDAVMRDKKRDRWFQERGATVLRFSTPEIQGDLNGCVAQIERTLARL